MAFPPAGIVHCFAVERAGVDIRVGTSGYNYGEWRGTFYPRDLPAARMLAYYGERFPTVEINATFYRMPSAAQVAAWARAVPDGFVFALKAPQRITHFARLRDVDEPVRAFCDVARALGPKLGPLLFQLPPGFRKDASRLADLLALLPPSQPVAMEFRHDSWFADDVYERLRGRGVALCVADTDERTTPLVATADFGYFRLRGDGYMGAELARWARMIRETSAWRQAFVYFKHEAAGRGPAFAAQFIGLLAGD
jgi:uncharacterized protein YecE (DUF72 family)